MDVRYAFVTNNSHAIGRAIRREAEPTWACRRRRRQVFTAISTTATLMRRRWREGTRVFAIGEHPLFDALSEGGFELVEDRAEVVVLGFDYHLTYAKLRTAVRAALGGAAVVVTNPDVLTPSDEGFEPCVGRDSRRRDRCRSDCDADRRRQARAAHD